MNICWSDFLGDIEVPDDYIEKKYKNLSSFKKQRGNNGIIRYEDFLFLTNVFPLLMLRHSLISDLRIYGAEWQEEMDDWIEYCSENFNSFQSLDGILAPYIDHYIDPVETVREIRDQT